MVEGEFQWSLHSVDSYKSTACLCRVRVKVSQPGNRRMLVFLTFKIFMAAFLSCVCQIRAASELPGYAASAPQEEHEEVEGGAVWTVQTPGQQRCHHWCKSEAEQLSSAGTHCDYLDMSHASTARGRGWSRLKLMSSSRIPNGDKAFTISGASRFFTIVTPSMKLEKSSL